MSRVMVLMVAWVPYRFADLLRALANLWSLGLVLAAAATLAWFVYSFFLRRYLRVRRIANIRLRRMLEEAAEARRSRE